MTHKKEIRNKYRRLRMELTESERSRFDDLLLILFQTADLPFLHILLSYWPIDENHEPNTHLFTDFLKFRNPELKICYPVTDFQSGTMQAIATEGDTPFEKKYRNLYEPDEGEVISPSDIELVFVPLLAFDRDGYRVGYGKGFYDKFLARCSKACIKCGFSYFEPVQKIEDRDEFDVPLDLCITPHNVYVF